MTIIEITALSNGAHRNQSGSFSSIPEGWAIVPENLGTPFTLENFPFGSFDVDYSGEYPVLTSWTPGEIPAPEETEEPESAPTLEEQVKTLQDENAQLKEKTELLESQLTDTQLALCDVYEAMLLTAGV